MFVVGCSVLLFDSFDLSYDSRSFELFVDVTSLDGGELSLVSIEDGTGVVMLIFVSMIVLGDDEFLVLRHRPS